MNASDSIKIIGASGREGKGEGQFAQPRGVCINHATKELFVVDCNNHRIQVFHLLSLSFIRQIGKGQQGSGPGFLTYPVGVCIDEEGHFLYVADTNNHRIVVFNYITGVYIRSIGSQGAEQGSLNCPYGVFVDATDRQLYVADYENNRIQVFDCETGNYLRMYGNGSGSGPGQFNQPIDVCLDVDLGHLIVADYSNNRVQVLEKKTGDFICSLGSNAGADSLNGPRALCLNAPSNLLFVSDRENHRIQIYNKTTFVLLRTIGQGLGVAPGQFNRPMELCVDNEEGVLIVVDGYNHRVQVMEIPELQQEKMRIREAKSTKPSLEVGKAVRPSLAAVSTPVQINSFRFKQFPKSLHCAFLETCKHHIPYLIMLSNSEILVLLKYFPNLLTSSVEIQKHEPLLLEDSAISSSRESFSLSRASSMDVLLSNQANMFLSILHQLPSLQALNVNNNSNREMAVLMSTPSVLGLYSLYLRGWKPANITSPLAVVKVLLNVLFNIDSAAINEAEVEKLTTSSVVLLKLVVLHHYSTVFYEFIPLVFQTFRSSCSLTDKYASLPMSELFNSPETTSKSADGKLLRKGLGSLFDVISFVFQFWGLSSADVKIFLEKLDGQEKNALLSSQIQFNSKQQTDSRLKDLVLLMFSLDTEAVSSSIQGKRKNSPHLNSSLFYLPFSFTDAVEKLLSLMQKEHKLFPPNTSSVTEENIGSVKIYEEILNQRHEFFMKSKSYFKDIHELNIFIEPKPSTKARGGRIIWDGVHSISPGDLLDCMDKEKSWFESLVLDVATDGSLKVHFMGWGSKWDDTILPSEITTRISPLNSYTKDWRSELFEGGLIEIKCNDDLVNQKWMWGKITKLNREENWLEVAYSFSNEPVVLKKGWLYGETICPVGMHTKDKSKAAAALITKPEKTVSFIVGLSVSVFTPF
jgi:DNA-binding beta-propeller fold protein YncE